MKKTIISILLAAGCASFLHAASELAPIPVRTTSVLLASVNMYDTTLMKSERVGFYDLRFTLLTSDPKQDAFYKVILTNTYTGQTYTYLSKRAISLVKGRMVTVEESVPVPKDISGNFTALISVYNAKGLPLANAQLKNIALVSRIFAPFAIENCVMTKRVYAKNEQIGGSCTVTGTTTPSSLLSISLSYNNEPTLLAHVEATIKNNKAVFAFPSEIKAGSYMVSVQAQEGMQRLGYSFQAGFLVEGSYSDILSVTFDKQVYEKGDIANVTVGLNVFSMNLQDLYAVASIKTRDSADLCGESKVSKVTRPGSLTFQIPITETCNGYSAKVVLTNTHDFVLDQYSIFVPAEISASFAMYANYLIAIGILLVLISTFIRSRKR